MSTRKPIDGMNAMGLVEAIFERIEKAHSIVDCLGNLDHEDGALDDTTMSAAAWAAKDLLKEAKQYLSVLQSLAVRQEGVAA